MVAAEADNPLDSGLSLKTARHRIFAKWMVDTYGVEFLSSGSGVLDVAGGNGELSRSLMELGVKSAVLLDPKPRCGKDIPEGLAVIAKALYDDGSDLIESSDETLGGGRQEGELIRQCSLIAGMHPDQATEPIVDLSQRLHVPFSLLPCCVLPSLFPFRRQKRHGDPVRSYSSFCQYLLDKAPEGEEYRQASLPFVGRNRVIYSQGGEQHEAS